LAAALLFAASVDAQFTRRDSGLYIRGHVRAEPNRAVENVKVELKRETGQILHSDFTRFNGQFEFFGLSVGVYVLEVDVAGYQPVRQVVEIVGQPGLGGVLIMLHPMPGAQTANPAQGSISARDLAIPAAARDYFQRAEEALRQKAKPEGAATDLKTAVKIFPDYYEAHHLLGVAYLEMGKRKEAEEAFRESVKVSKEGYGPAYSGLASLLCDAQKFEGAEPLARRAIELEARAWQGHFELARVLVGLGRPEEAEASATRAIEMNKDLARGYLLLAKIHQALKDYPAMLADVDEFLRREPKGPTSEEIRKTRAQLAKALRDAGMEVPAEPPRL
jgi:Tfp pilus assembly protein PilF